ncbi:hypothetical protein, partial [Ruegeria faecimaris]|uniref:hypothetical protein n=1 Tax=Ruegeria faecimaris TaxID=686389 RepID=UPI002490D340
NQRLALGSRNSFSTKSDQLKHSRAAAKVHGLRKWPRNLVVLPADVPSRAALDLFAQPSCTTKPIRVTNARGVD